MFTFVKKIVDVNIKFSFFYLKNIEKVYFLMILFNLNPKCHVQKQDKLYKICLV